MLPLRLIDTGVEWTGPTAIHSTRGARTGKRFMTADLVQVDPILGGEN